MGVLSRVLYRPVNLCYTARCTVHGAGLPAPVDRLFVGRCYGILRRSVQRGLAKQTVDASLERTVAWHCRVAGTATHASSWVATNLSTAQQASLNAASYQWSDTLRAPASLINQLGGRHSPVLTDTRRAVTRFTPRRRSTHADKSSDNTVGTRDAHNDCRRPPPIK